MTAMLPRPRPLVARSPARELRSYICSKPHRQALVQCKAFQVRWPECGVGRFQCLPSVQGGLPRLQKDDIKRALRLSKTKELLFDTFMEVSVRPCEGG